MTNTRSMPNLQYIYTYPKYARKLGNSFENHGDIVCLMKCVGSKGLIMLTVCPLQVKSVLT